MIKWLLLVSILFTSPLALANDPDGMPPLDDEDSCVLIIRGDLSALNQLLEYVDEVSNAKTKTTRELALFKTAERINKKKKLPDVLEVPTILGAAYRTHFAGLSQSDQKTIRDEMVREALEAHPEAREALVEKLGGILLKQFSEDYTIPTFVQLAEAVNSSGSNLARHLFGPNTTNKKAYKKLIYAIKHSNLDKFEIIRKNFVTAYTKRAREYGRTLSLEEFYQGIVEGRPEIRDHFTRNHLAFLLNEDMAEDSGSVQKPYIRLFDSLEDVYHTAYERSPKTFDKVLDKYSINAESQEKIIEALREKKRIFVTSAAPGVEVHEEAFATMVKMAEKMDGAVVVFAEAGQPMNLDPALRGHSLVHIIHDDIEITPWLKLNTLPVHFKRVDPLSPLRAPGRGGPREQSQIVGHPQMRDEITPTNDNHLHSRRLVSTGAITKPWYAAKHPIGGVTDDQARDVHKIGFYLLEKDRDDSGVDGTGVPGTFYGRHVEWSEHSKSYTDLGTKHSLRAKSKATRFSPNPKEDFSAQLEEAGIEENPEGHGKLVDHYLKKRLITSNNRPLYFVLGDKHIGGEDHYGFTRAEIDMIRAHRPRNMVLHDLIDLNSINHWEAQDIVKMAEKARNGELGLKDELDKMMAYINQALLLDPEMNLIVVESNHNAWLSRLLKEVNRQANFGSQPIDDPLIAELVHVKMNEGMDPLEYYVKYRRGAIAQSPIRNLNETRVAEVVDADRIQFLPKGASLKAGPYDFSKELGEHGHNGPGFRTMGVTLQASAGRSYTGIMYGHTHSAGRNGNAANVAASIGPRQEYALGGASGVNMGGGFIYEDGTMQVYIFDTRSGEFALADGEPLPPDEFYFYDPETGIVWPRSLENEEKDKNLGTLDQFRSDHSGRRD